jgi:chromosome segregation ATPase
MTTLQDLQVKLKELKEEKAKWEKEQKEFNKKYYIIKKTLSGLDSEINTLEKQIKQQKDADTLQEWLKEMDELHTDALTSDEKIIIVNKMDKTDYRQYDATIKRWLDLDKIIKEVTETKTQYPGWTLKDIQLVMQLDSFPPQNIYHYSYTTPLGHIVSFGGETI